ELLSKRSVAERERSKRTNDVLSGSCSSCYPRPEDDMGMSRTCLDEIAFGFRKQKEYADKAFSQVQADSDFFRKPGEFSNSIAAIIKHVAGNLSSRWRDFLTSDGEKPDRNRDAEFVIGEKDTRANLIAGWEAGWSTLFDTLANLTDDDFQKTVLIRGE